IRRGSLLAFPAHSAPRPGPREAERSVSHLGLSREGEMDGATLRLLDALRGVSYPGGPHTRDALEAFARLLVGWPLAPADDRWVEELAARAELRWNGERAEPFRVVYEAAIARGRTIDITDETVRGGALALEGLMLLPLRERAVLATACVLGFDH